MATALKGPLWKKFSRDDDGNRTYRIAFLVQSSVAIESFTNLLVTTGLPVPGDSWGYDGDTDAYAYCSFITEINQAPEYKQEKGYYWVLTYTFSTKVPDRCQTAAKGDPLSEPPKITVSSIKATEEMSEDRHGEEITTSSHEPIKGPPVEFNRSKWQVKIVQNVVTINLPLLVSMKDTVNDAKLWGMAPRCVLLADVNAEPHYQSNCLKYWTRSLTFEADAKTWDKEALDEGNKVLIGKWDLVTGDWVVGRIGGLKRPTKPTLVADFSGGPVLSVDNYVYRIVAMDSDGGTTAPSDAGSLQLSNAATKITLSWAAIDGAIEYHIYGRKGPVGDLKLIDTTSDLTYIDDGSVTPSGDIPVNDTSGTTPDKDNPKHFIRFKDPSGNVCRVVLNGAGLPSGKPIGSGATASVTDMALKAVKLTDYKGSGYQVGDLLNPDGGTHSVIAVIKVDSVDGSGAVTGVSVDTGGVYTVLPTTANRVTGGALGINAIIDLEWEVLTVAVNAGGANYTVAPTAKFKGGGGSGTTAAVNTTSGAVSTVVVTAGGTGYTEIPKVLIESTGKPGMIPIDYYDESDFTQLGIPTNLEVP